MNYYLFFIIFLLNFSLNATRIGVCIMATGKYSEYAQDLINSARKFFCTNHSVTYFVFTDEKLVQASDVMVTDQKRLGWPYDTLLRFHVYYNNRTLFESYDYLYALDADMLLLRPTGDEILGELVATRHPGFIDRCGEYDKNPHSTAYVEVWNGTPYFCGGFYGGKRESFIQLLEKLVEMVNEDFQKGYHGRWHDESYLNRYFIDHQPTTILSPAYCFPQNPRPCYYSKKLWDEKPYIVARDKNHEVMRKK